MIAIRTRWAAIMLAAWVIAFPPTVRADDDLSSAQAAASPAVVGQETEVYPAQGEDEEDAYATVGNGPRDLIDVRVISWRDIPFQTVKRQKLDYSCGAAALATLLSYSYRAPTSEKEVFRAMFEAGNKRKIRTQGFSLLDMSKYLNARSYRAIGYRATLDALEKADVPFIALVNNEGYNHFVVVKSLRKGRVLVGDPSRGSVIYPRAAFLDRWNGIALIVTNKAHSARAATADKKDWLTARSSGLRDVHEIADADTAYAAPMNIQMAPVGMDILGGVMNPSGNVSVEVR